MSSSVLYMSMSLDGFIAGPNDRAVSALGQKQTLRSNRHVRFTPESGHSRTLVEMSALEAAWRLVNQKSRECITPYTNYRGHPGSN